MARLLIVVLSCLILPLANAARLDLTPYRGRVVVVDFWASWCEPCRASFPWLNTIQRRHAAAGLTVITVNLDEERSAADAFLKEIPNQLPVIYDPGGRIAQEYELLAMPTSLLFDRNGTLRQRHNGFLQSRENTYEEHIRALLRD